MYSYPVTMKKGVLSRKKMSSVACPVCGVAIGKRCVLYSDALRMEPHLRRMVAAIEDIGKKIKTL
jgi:hypothetical protein